MNRPKSSVSVRFSRIDPERFLADLDDFLTNGMQGISARGSDAGTLTLRRFFSRDIL
jgi:hypothetical protein